jgi:hypothetical protein
LIKFAEANGLSKNEAAEAIVANAAKIANIYKTVGV